MPSPSPSPSPDSDSDSLSLSVILEGPGTQTDQHWSLHLHQTTPILTIQALGLTSRNWRVDITHKPPSPESDPTYHSSMLLTTRLRKSDVARIEEMAKSLKLNRWPGWNCQDFVMDLLDAMEGEGGGVIDVKGDTGTSRGYREQKEKLRAVLHKTFPVSDEEEEEDEGEGDGG